MSVKTFENLISSGLKPGVTAFHHKGEWAIHEALSVLLSHTGPAHVMMETFNISEDALRPMFFHLEKGEILSLNLILDMNVKRHKLEMLLFAAGLTPNIYITACHAKVLLIENNSFRIGIVGSANANQPIRYEAGFMFCNDDSLFHFFKMNLSKVI